MQTTIYYYGIGIVVPPYIFQVHDYTGVGCISGMMIEHHQYVYQLYLDNPFCPLDGYVQELLNEFGLIVSNDITQRWFMEIGSFKGTMRVTSRFPSGQNSWATCELLQ